MGLCLGYGRQEPQPLVLHLAGDIRVNLVLHLPDDIRVCSINHNSSRPPPPPSQPPASLLRERAAQLERAEQAEQARMRAHQGEVSSTASGGGDGLSELELSATSGGDGS